MQNNDKKEAVVGKKAFLDIGKKKEIKLLNETYIIVGVLEHSPFDGFILLNANAFLKAISILDYLLT